MKYIDSDKLIAEIERMREINRKAFIAEHIKADIFHGRAQAINHLFEFITSLQQEQPEVELEEETDRFLSNATPVKKGVYEITRLGFKAVARHFYELGLNARKEK